MCSRRRKAPSVPASLQRSASASNRRFSLPENWRRLAIATTSGSRRAPSPEAISPVALPAPSATASEEETDNPFREDFSNEVMFMSYLYSKLPETGVSPHIGTGGVEWRTLIKEACIEPELALVHCRNCRSVRRARRERVDLDRCGHAGDQTDAVRYLIDPDAHRHALGKPYTRDDRG